MHDVWLGRTLSSARRSCALQRWTRISFPCGESTGSRKQAGGCTRMWKESLAVQSGVRTTYQPGIVQEWRHWMRDLHTHAQETSDVSLNWFELWKSRSVQLGAIVAKIEGLTFELVGVGVVWLTSWLIWAQTTFLLKEVFRLLWLRLLQIIHIRSGTN